ncbi:RrF2 family transcriptional regulator [Halalkalibaculum sp. DA3122]|uniref:RrF2 family transcriptional regulator n=1 Tax=unclassified Halalkalibaculum TaxID=2964617 RepID=UPI00375506B2
MLLSKSCVYGLRAALYLASHDNGKYISIGEMSEKLDISFHFLTKTLQQLSAAELMESYKGPNGGIKLAKPGDEITLLEIVVAIDGSELLTECALGLPGCGVQKPCPLHDSWSETRGAVKNMLEETTLTNLADKGKKMNLRLTPEGGAVWD